MKGAIPTISRVAFLMILFLHLLIFPPMSTAEETTPELHRSKASPSTVHFGTQPQGSPLILSISTEHSQYVAQRGG